MQLQNALGTFKERHIGPDFDEVQKMARYLGFHSLDSFVDAVVPRDIRFTEELSVGHGATEAEALAELKALAGQNQVFKSYIGLGYTDTVTPTVILRNVLENPGWYTQYTPYQAEIAQGRLEALLNFQTMVSDLTKLPVANASLLDEGTAAAEAMVMCHHIKSDDKHTKFFAAQNCHPQTLAVVQTRAAALGISVVVGNPETVTIDDSYFGALLAYPATDGSVIDHSAWIAQWHQHDALVVMCADIMVLLCLKAPGDLGADIAVGSTQRFGVPLGFGGPHAAYLATRDEFKRQIPGRIVGVSKDASGNPAIRLALQTREQHIRRDKASSNICTAQVLLAVMASFYAVYHGPQGLRHIAETIHARTVLLANTLAKLGLSLATKNYFDTIRITLSTDEVDAVKTVAEKHGINFRVGSGWIGVTLDETTTVADVEKIAMVFQLALQDPQAKVLPFSFDSLASAKCDSAIPLALTRANDYLKHPVFNKHHSETEMLRYICRLQAKDLSLTTSMIPLGSCTMKLNATTEMIPVTWEGFSKIHPFAPDTQTRGYAALNTQLAAWLANITGFAAVSLQPNAGSQGEYAGLLVIRKFHEERGEAHRRVCLIPASAHGTNPASATLAGMKVIVVKCDAQGNIDVTDLQAKAKEHARDLAALMVTYPSTHGVFEAGIREVCQIVHAQGGQVYMDGANMNAQVGLCRPGDIGADVCHLNLHKTFCIPHGGGGPGMGPIGVAAHLAPYLPAHPVVSTGGEKAVGAVSAAPWGSAGILPISYAYIRMMGAQGLKQATQVAILNANYMAKKLSPHYPVLYKGQNGLVAHECIIDLRPLKAVSGVEVEDVAKRLMDYGFHAPTISFPVPGTMMIEPTESEPLEEMDRFCDALIQIRGEIAAIVEGKMDRQNNPLKNAPHTAQSLAQENWDRPYSREQAVYPVAWLKEFKFWPSVARIDNAYGDRNLMCSCLPVAEYEHKA